MSEPWVVPMLASSSGVKINKMFTHARRAPDRSFWLLLLVVSLLLALGVSCNAQMKLTPVVSSSVPTKIKGIGLNGHMEEMPVADLKRIGIQWLRLDLGGRPMNADKINHIVQHYKDFGILWIISTENHDPVEEAKLVVKAGVRDLEIMNEPDYQFIDPKVYAQLFKKIRAAVGNDVRLYGMASGKWVWSQPFIKASLAQKLPIDVLTFHAYLDNNERMPAMTTWVNEAKQYGLPVVVSEVGFPTMRNYRAIYGEGASYGDLFVKTKKALAGVPWAWYDGPNPPDNFDAGMFDHTPERGWYPNKNYIDVCRALGIKYPD